MRKNRAAKTQDEKVAQDQNRVEGSTAYDPPTVTTGESYHELSGERKPEEMQGGHQAWEMSGEGKRTF